MVPWKSAAPLLELGGTSPSPTMRAEIVKSPSLCAFVEKLLNNNTANAANGALMHSFFISCSLFRHQEHAGQGEAGLFVALSSRKINLRKDISAGPTECQ